MEEDGLTKKFKAETFELERRQFLEKRELQERQQAETRQLEQQRLEQFEADLVDLGVAHVEGRSLIPPHFDAEKPGKRHFFAYQLQEGERLIDAMEGIPSPYLVATQHEGESLVRHKVHSDIGFHLLACCQGFVYVSGDPSMVFEGERGQQQELRRYFLGTAGANHGIALLIVKDV